MKHIEKYPVSTLSLLPLYTRERLLQWLSIADICQLEDTTFVKGISMADIWNFIPLEDCIDDDDEVNEMQTMEYLVDEMGRAQFHKTILYGAVVSGYFGLAQGCYVGRSFLLPSQTIKFLYGIRNFTVTDASIYKTQRYHNSLIFPPRYQDKADIHQIKDIIDATISCFRGELPKILVNLLNCCPCYEYIYLLCDIRYLSIVGVRGKEPACESLIFAHNVVKQATHLEVLSLHGRGYPHGYFESDPLSLDCLCSELSHHPIYWSNMRILEILDCCPGYSVSLEIFDQLISAYLSAPTNYAQKVTLVGVSVLSDHEHQSLSFDHDYLQFKTIKLVDCQFILKHRATSFKTILASWIGQEINVLQEDDNDVDAVSFQVVKSSSHLPVN